MRYENIITTEQKNKLIALVGTNVDNIVLCESESNGYHDSDWHAIYIDLPNGTLNAKLVNSTRFGGGFEPVPNSVELDSLTDEVKVQVNEIANEIAKAYAKEYLMSKGSRFHIGEVVNVSNNRARKFKGETFVIGKIEDRFFKGSKVGTFLVSKCGTIYTNMNNVTKVETPNYIIEKCANTILIGLQKLERYYAANY